MHRKFGRMLLIRIAILGIFLRCIRGIRICILITAPPSLLKYLDYTGLIKHARISDICVRDITTIGDVSHILESAIALIGVLVK